MQIHEKGGKKFAFNADHPSVPLFQTHPVKHMKNWIHINLTLQRTTKNSLSRAGFELASSSFWTAALPTDLSSQLGLVASLIQFMCTKYFRDDLTLVFEDAQCFNSISEPS